MQRTFGSGRVPSATDLSELVLCLLVSPQSPLVFKGYSGKAIHLCRCQIAKNLFLRADIL